MSVHQPLLTLHSATRTVVHVLQRLEHEDVVLTVLRLERRHPIYSTLESEVLTVWLVAGEDGSLLTRDGELMDLHEWIGALPEALADTVEQALRWEA